MTPKPRVFADLQGADPLGRVRLMCVGTLQDLSRYGIRLEDGLVLNFYDSEFEFEGRVLYAPEERSWVAEVDWDHIWAQAGRPVPDMYPSAARERT